MFDNLLESKPKKEKTVGQTIFSVVMHTIIIIGAIKATSGAAQTMKKILADTNMMFIKPPDPPPPPPPDKPPPETVVATNPPPQGFQTLVPPKDIPTEIPPVNLNEKFDPKDFSGKGVEGGIAQGVVGGTGPVIPGASYTMDQVDEQVKYIGGGDPKYPSALRQVGIEGTVELRFIVGVDGKVEGGSITVLSSTNKAFEDPAIEAIKRARFSPAKIHGSAVRQLVQQAVKFQIG